MSAPNPATVRIQCGNCGVVTDYKIVSCNMQVAHVQNIQVTLKNGSVVLGVFGGS
jgi:hypothetical protein